MVKPKLSVLMPVYNAEKFLREAIDSILEQSFEQFEFIIVDDGSSDNSWYIIQSYQDNRIRPYKNSVNLGISETLNKGIELCETDLIARMDADDIAHPERLRKQLNYMAMNPHCAMVSSWAEVVDENKNFVRLERYRNEFYFYNLTFECWIYHPTVLFRKGCVKSVGGYSKKYSEDYDLFWKLSVRYKIGNIAEPLVKYRLSSTSLNTVLKKKEYDVANEENVIRNICYYLGNNIKVSNSALECLRHNFDLILKEENFSEVCCTLDLLDKITNKMIERPNPNADPFIIKQAAFYKRRFIILELSKRLPLYKKFFLLSAVKEWWMLYHISFQFIRRRMHSLFLKFA